LLSHADKYNVAESGTPGSMKFMLKEMGGATRDIYLTPKQKEADPLAQLNKSIKEQTLANMKTNKSIDKLAPEQQAVATGLSQKNASKIAIKNQIDSVMGNWDKLDDEQKIVQGRQLLKTLNSTEGADAIGSEEAKRLGGLLEFQMFNVNQPGPMFGRDLKGFKTQAMDTSSAIGRAVDANREIIEQMTGRKQSYQGSSSPIVNQLTL